MTIHHADDRLALALQPRYSRFRVADRLLFTGHSHQAWPDAAFEGMEDYAATVAERIDTKWEVAAEKTETLRGYLRGFYDDPHGRYCRETNTHMLLVSWLSSLDLASKPRIVSTEGEFHSMHRQLEALRPFGIEVVRVPADDADTLGERIAAQLDERTAAVMVSRVFFETAVINPCLSGIADDARKMGIPLLVDDYHGTNVVPLSLRAAGLEDVYILIGGYKYLQWGEGNCFLRFPPDSPLKPAVTGWFSAFGHLDRRRMDGVVAFDPGDQRFASATYDPVSQFRASATVAFFREMGLTPDLLREQYQSRLRRLFERFSAMDFDPGMIGMAHETPLDGIGGFMALRSPRAGEIRSRLMSTGVFTDSRGDILRIGPAPYTTLAQCDSMIHALWEVVGELRAERGSAK